MIIVDLALAGEGRETGEFLPRVNLIVRTRFPTGRRITTRGVAGFMNLGRALKPKTLFILRILEHDRARNNVLTDVSGRR